MREGQVQREDGYRHQAYCTEDGIESAKFARGQLATKNDLRGKVEQGKSGPPNQWLPGLFLVGKKGVTDKLGGF
jgi:hypothetical protein